MANDLRERIPKLYGSVTLGERGQVVIPAEARRNLEIAPGAKLLVFGGQRGRALAFIKAESLAEFIAETTAIMSHFEQMLKTNPTEISRERPSDTDS